ncbi:MAG: helix-turn-helix domain-containing protein [Pseudomonadales bacterium]
MSEGPEPGPGGRLRAARAAMNVEIREVADALNLPTGTIEAIEANAYELLPNRVFARGYVRAYAKLVELEPDAIVQAFQAASEPHGQTPVTNSAVSRVVAVEQLTFAERLGALRTRLETRVQENPLQALGLTAAGLSVLFVLLWLLSRDAPSVAEPREEPAAGVPVAPAVNRASTEDVAPGAQRGGFTDVSEVETTVAGRSSPVAGPADSVVRLGPGEDRLRFSFVADCWVEVRNGEDQVLYSDLGQSNKQLELTGQGPFRILLGYAPGVQLAFNGENVVLTPHTRNDVARLVLGQ